MSEINKFFKITAIQLLSIPPAIKSDLISVWIFKNAKKNIFAIKAEHSEERENIFCILPFQAHTHSQWRQNLK